MSASTSPSSANGQGTQGNEPQLPSGQCCAFLLEPEVKGQRCGCVHFGLNRSRPGSFCECGHNACYHAINGEMSSASENPEATQLRQRLDTLERNQEQLQMAQQNVLLLEQRISADDDRSQKVVVRLSRLEDTLEKSQGDVSREVQAAYNNLGRAWDSIAELLEYKRTTENRFRLIEEHLRTTSREVARIGERQLDLVDVDIGLEERLDGLDSLEARIERIERRLACLPITSETVGESNSGSEPATPQHTQAQRETPLATSNNRRSMSPASSLNSATTPTTAVSIPRSVRPMAPIPLTTTVPVLTTTSTRTTRAPAILTMPPDPIPAASISSEPMALRSTAGKSSHELWTVHISLMPTSTRPFPFERDTTAYKRCLSRGLHQMVAVNGPSAEAFAQAVNKAFGHIIRGRRWAPLQALPCTAERLAGLPMLRELDNPLLDGPFDLNFLRDHCAVMDIHGRMDSLYIAMRDKTLSWHSIWRFPPFLEGLEPCWLHDKLLDGPLDGNTPLVNDLENDVSSSEDEIMGGMWRPPRPPAGDIVATLSTHPTLKRAASDISRSSSFGSATAIAPSMISMPTATEGEGSRPKVARVYQLDNIVEVRRGVTTL